MGRVARIVQWLPLRRETWRVVDQVASGADVPERLPPGGAVLVRALDVDLFLGTRLSVPGTPSAPDRPRSRALANVDDPNPYPIDCLAEYRSPSR